MTFLIVTNRRDITSDYIVRELKRRNHDFFRLNTETIAGCKVEIRPDQFLINLHFQDRTLQLDEVKAAYFRRPEEPLRPSENVNEEVWKYAVSEWNALLKSVYVHLGDKWFSHPSKIVLAEDKPRQLMIAAKLSMKIPETVISNALSDVRNLAMDGGIIGKPLKLALVQADRLDRVIFTNRITSLNIEDERSINICPAIYQREIAKKFDVRVTVVGSRVFAVAIHSQENHESSVDWRRGSNPNLAHEPISLPEEIAAQCIAVVRDLGLRFGAIDLVSDTQGAFWFLECNPNGQWAWIENRTGLPIAAAIVDELEEIANQ